MRFSDRVVRAFAAALVLSSASVLAQAPAMTPEQPASFERLDGLIARDQVADAAAELAAIVTQSASSQPALSPAQEAILHQAIETSRKHLGDANLSAAERKSSRQLLCLARAYFAEELPEPPSAESSAPLRVGGDVKRPEIVSQIKPEYSPEAREKGLIGTVILESVIDREGCVRDVHVLKGLPMGLDEAATASLRHWAFEPSTLNGEPVKVYYIVTVNFQVEKKTDGAGDLKPTN
jgi:TonB family protein